MTFKKIVALTLCVFTFTLLGETSLNENIMYSDLTETILKLKNIESSKNETIDDIRNLLGTWEKYKARTDTIHIINEEHRLRNDPIVLIEWGGGGYLYNSIIVTAKSAIFINKNIKKIEPKKISLEGNSISQVNGYLKRLSKYSGDASIYGRDIQSFFFTIWKDGKIVNTFVIYSLPSTLNDIYFNRMPSDKTFFNDTLNAARLLDIILKIVNINTIGQPYNGKNQFP